MASIHGVEVRKSGRMAAIGFSLALLLLGMVGAFAGFLLVDPTAPVVTLPSLLNLPPWFRWMVWIVIYPALGVAVWQVWRCRDRQAARPALRYFAVYFLFNIAFVPLTSLLPGLWTAFILDVMGLVGALVLWWFFRRATVRATPWLLPLLIWLPITTINKIPGILTLLGG